MRLARLIAFALALAVALCVPAAFAINVTDPRPAEVLMILFQMQSHLF